MPQFIALSANAALTQQRQSLLANPSQGALQPVVILQQPASHAAATGATVISLADILSYLRKHWKLGFLLALPLAALTFQQLGMGKKIYEAESRLLLRLQDPNVFGFSELAKTNVTELSAPMLVNNHRSELKSRRFADHLAKSMPASDIDALITDAKVEKSWTTVLKEWISPPKPSSPLPKDELFARVLDDSVRVEPLKDSFILRVQVRTGNPSLAARVANLYVSDYIKYVTEEELKTTKASSDFLGEKVAEIRARLQKSEEELTAYRQSHGLLQDSEVKDVASDRVRLLTTSIADAMVRLTKAREDSRTLQSARNTGREPLDLKLIAENADVATTRKTLEAKIAERAPLMSWAGARHPRMIAINQEIDTARESLKRNMGAVVTMVETDVATLGKQIEDLEHQLEDARQDVLAAGGKNIHGNLLRDKVAADRDLYQKIITRMNESDLTGQFKESGLLRVADVAVAPENPMKPKKSIALLASMMVFGFCFFGIPLSLGFYEQQVRPALIAQDEKTTSEPVADSSASYNGALAASRARTTVLARLPDVKGTTSATLVAEMIRPGSKSSGSLSDLANTLEERAAHRQGTGIVLVTSAMSGEGKTAIASALAASLCGRGRKVFMIECNPEAPTFNTLFPHSSLQAGKDASGVESLRYGASNLYLLPTQARARYEQFDMLENYRKWIDRARSQVDWIILDGSSVMQSFTDLAPLLPLATEVLLVHDESRGEQFRCNAALNLLKPRLAESTLCGVVLNHAA